MEPTLLCARPGTGCTASFNDRVLVAKIVYRFRDPKRFEIAVFHAPARARKLCSEGGTYLKRVIGLPGEQVSETSGFFYVNGKKLHEPYLSYYARDSVTKTWPRLGPKEYFMMGDNRHRVVRLAHVGSGRAQRVHRPGRRDVLAADALDSSVVKLFASSTNDSVAAERNRSRCHTIARCARRDAVSERERHVRPDCAG